MPEDMSEYMPEDMSDRMPEDMSEYMPEDMPDRVPEDMSDRVPEDMPDRMPEDSPDRMPEDMPDHMPEDMPDRMSNRMSEDMSDRMPEDLPVRKCINVMVGITRSRVIFFRQLPMLVVLLTRAGPLGIWDVPSTSPMWRWSIRWPSSPRGSRGGADQNLTAARRVAGWVAGGCWDDYYILLLDLLVMKWIIPENSLRKTHQ